MAGEYWNETWNPITGCSPESEGCVNCWARMMYMRFHRGRFDISLHPERMDAPLRWKKPRTAFACNMTDLFHEEVPADWIQSIVDVMAATRNHRFLICTKRASRMLSILPHMRLAWGTKWEDSPPENIAVGVTVELASHLDRVTALEQVPAARRWVSVEPCLGPIALTGTKKVDWVVCGPETGPGARPFDPAWAEELARQCREMGIQFWAKGVHMALLPKEEFPWPTKP